MAFNTILAATRVSPGTSDTDEFPAITALANGSFALTYNVIDFVNVSQTVSQVFDAQGQLVQSAFATPLPHFNEEVSSIAALSGGGYALAWERQVDVGSHLEFQVFTAVYDNQGNLVSVPVGGAGADADPASDAPRDPQVSALSGGGYVVSWLIQDQAGNRDIVAAVYNSAGQEMVAPVNVTNSPGVDEQANFLTTSVAGLATGGFALTWTTRNSDIDHDVYTAIYNAQGQQVLAPLNVTRSAGIDENIPQIAVLANGNYALTWDGVIGAQQDLFTYTAVFDARGNLIAAPSVVGSGEFSHVAALTNGNYALFWDDRLDVFTAVYDGQGQQLVAPVNVSNAPGRGDTAHGGITALANGAYAVTWEGQVADGSYDIFTAVYGAAGQELVAPVNVSNSPGVDDTLETVEARATANGSYAITWQGPGSILNAEYMAIYQFVPSGTPGDVSVVGSPDINIDLGALIDVGGNVTISDNHFAVTIDLHNLASVGGSFVISDNGALLTITLPSLATVSGDLDISNNAALGAVDIGGTSVGGDLDISDNDSAGVIDISGSEVDGDLIVSDNDSAGVIDANGTEVSGDLTISDNDSADVIDISGSEVGGDLIVSDNDSAGVIDASGSGVSGDLTISDNDSVGVVDISGSEVSGDLIVSDNTSVITIDLGALTQAGAIIIADNGVITLNLAALVNVGGTVSLTNNDRLLSIDMPELTTVGGDLVVNDNDSASGLNFGALSFVGGDIDITNNDLAGAINLSAGEVGGDINVANNDLASAISVSAGKVGGDINITNNDSAGVINISGTNTVSGSINIDLTPDATVDASALGPGGGSVHVIGDDGHETDVILGNLANLGGTLTITTADGVTLTSTAGLSTITLTGTSGDNTLIGSLTARNVVLAGGGNDTASGGGADDTFTGGGGNDALDGKGGADTAVYSGQRGDYSIVQNADGSLTVSDQRAGAPDGTDTLRNFELFQFADSTLALADVLPPTVITSNGGSDSAQVSVAENSTAVAQVTATNPNAAQTLSFSLAGGADEGMFAIDPVTGALAFTAAPNFEQRSDAGQNGVYDVIVRVSDGLHVDTQALAITVTDVNEAPTLANQTAGQSATAGVPFALTLPANVFQDVDNGDQLTLAATFLPAWLSFDPSTGAFSGTPGAGDVGGFDVRVTATDTGGLSAEETFHVTVAAANVNHAPVITSDLGGTTASVIIDDDTRYVATVHAVDPDPGTTLTYSIVGGADQRLFAIDGRTGVLTFKSTPQDGHSYQVRVAASDGSLQDTQAIKVQVANGPFEFGNAGVADTFVFKPHFGLASLTGFDATSASHDVLELDHALFRNGDPNASPQQVFNLIQAHSFQLGPDVIIFTDTKDIIDLRNVNIHSLTAGDFLLT